MLRENEISSSYGHLASAEQIHTASLPVPYRTPRKYLATYVDRFRITLYPSLTMENLIGSKLRKWRLRAGMTQADAARHFKVNQPIIARWESGETKIPIFHLLRLEKLIERQEKGERLAREGKHD